MPLVTGKIEPESVFKAGLAEIKGRAKNYGKDKHRVFSSEEESGGKAEPRRERGQELAVSDINSCEQGCLHGLKIWSKVGEAGAEIAAELCACTDELNGELREQLEARANSICMSDIPPLFANRRYMGRTFAEATPPTLQTWLKEVCEEDKLAPQHSCIFLCGNVGNGKTHMASDCIKHFIMATGYSSRYFTASSLVEIKKDSIIYGSRQYREDKDRVDYFKQAMHSAGLMVVDEIRESLSKTEASYLEEFIDMRYNTGLPTIFISNHTFNKKTSYKGITIQRVLGERIADRMRASLYHEFNAPSRRGVRTPDSYTAEEMQQFSLPKPVLAQKEGELQILNWMTRNPIFEPIDRRERKVAVDKNGNKVFANGVPVDADREHLKVCRDVWQKGDQLILGGPVLCEKDAKTYLVCLDLLKQQHSKGKFGLSLVVTSHDLISALRKRTNSSDNWEATHRSLARIASATITYTDDLSRQWRGPLFSFSYDPNVNDGKYKIDFNKSMIEFYKTYEYAKLHRKLFDSKIGTDGVRMQMFLRSHNSTHFDRMDFNGWMKFLGKPVAKMDSSPGGRKLRAYHRHKFSKLVRDQIRAGFLTSDSALKRGKKISLTITTV